MGSKTAGSVGGVGPQQPQQQMGDVPAFPMPQMQPMPGAAPAGMGDVNYYGNSVLPPGPLNPAPGGKSPGGMGDVNYWGNSVLPFGGDQRAIEDALRLAQQQMGQSQPVPGYKESGSMFVPPEISGRRSALNPFRDDLVRPDKLPNNNMMPSPYVYKDSSGRSVPIGIPPARPPITNQGPGIGLAPPANNWKESGGMFVPPEVSGRRSELNPFRPNPAPVKDTFQADLGRPNPSQDYVSSTMLNWIMGGGGKMPLMQTADRRPVNPNELSPEQQQRFNEYMRSRSRPPKQPPLPGTPGPALPPGYKGSGVNPELVAGYRPPITNQGPGIGLAPPALPPGLDYNTMPPSVRDMFAPRPAQPAPKPQIPNQGPGIGLAPPARPPITNQGPGIGLAPPALPAGLNYNTMPPSVRSMFAPNPMKQRK